MRNKLNRVHPEDRAKTIAEIGKHLNIKDGMSRQGKVRAIANYLDRHPHTPIMYACEAAGVNHHSVRYHLYRAKGEFTAFAARRDTALRLIAEFHPDKGMLVNQSSLLRAIHARGFRLSLNTLRDILKTNGYVLTTSGNEARIKGQGRMIVDGTLKTNFPGIAK